MIAKQHRFHGRNAINYAYRKGRTVRSSYCTLRYVYNGRRRTYRAAVVVSRKLSKSAVVRNRIRRRLYEQLRQGMEPSKPYDMILTPHSEQIADMPEKQLNEIISEILQILNVNRDEPRKTYK